MSETKITSYDLITDHLVKEALNNLAGPDAELIFWEVKDFTKKGDNYSSLVTSISVQYTSEKKTCEATFVVKLNPLRPFSSLSEVLETMYGRETIILDKIIPSMSKELSKLDLPPIKAPTLFARSLERGREAFVTEDLRKQGFKMYDRTKGMDISRALLVMEEQGRFHASSLLYEESLAPKTIPESFEYFEEPWLDETNKGFQMFNLIIGGQLKNACKFLSNIPKYGICVTWLNDKLPSIASLFVKAFHPCKPFDVLIHGDCWTNNILFQYDSEGNPSEIRFVDLQGSRKSSPACDLNYFFYTSLTGEVRLKYYTTLLDAYYKSFLKVLTAAGRESPFSFSEFENEMQKRKLFGLLSGMTILPGILAEDDEIWEMEGLHDGNIHEFVKISEKKFSLISEREGPFKERFLSMFDEMIEAKIFDQ